MNTFTKFLIPLCFLIVCISCKKYPETIYEPLNFELEENNGLYVPKGWNVTLWAESPMLYNPTNMDVDARGRIWVTEAVNYRNFNNKEGEFFHHKAGDRVVILEDTDADGVADKSKVFVQDSLLVSPLGIAVIGNKVYVSCAPNLFVYTDEDGDDVADKREIFLTGFGGLDHDHSLHAIVGGPDGELYFNTGNAGPHTVTDKAGWTLRSGSIYTGGTPHNKVNSGARVSDDGKIWVGGLALRIGEDGKGLGVMSHNFRNAYELAVDSYGNLWQNDNDDGVVTCRFTWLMEGGNAGFFSADGTRTWQGDRRPHQSNFTAHWHQEDPGVIPSGDNTGAGAPTGVAMYEGNLFGNQFNGMAMTADAGRNTIFAYKPKVSGAGFELERHILISSVKEQEENYIWHDISDDKAKWFRPSDVMVGTDGAIYVSDWYDPVVGGHRMNEKEGYGRIYRVTPPIVKPLAPVINFSTTEQQLAALKSPAVNVRYSALKQLIKSEDNIIPQVEKLLYSENHFDHARAVWLLSNLGEKGQASVINLLEHPNANIRMVAVRALRKVLDEEALLTVLSNKVKDPSSVVRREVILALNDLPFEKYKSLIGGLINGFDGKDRWYLEALGYTLEANLDKIWSDIRNEYGSDPINWSDKYEALVWRFHPASMVSDLEERASSSEVALDARKKAVVALAFINDATAIDAMERLGASNLPDVASHAKWWLKFRKTNTWFDLREWEASETLEPQKVAKTYKEDNGITYSFENILKLKGEPGHGASVFIDNCTTCHKFHKKGNNIGPDLTRIRNKHADEGLLAAIVDPNEAVEFGFEPWKISLKDGKMHIGFLLADGETVVIRDIAGNDSVFKASQVAKKEQLRNSLMPSASSIGLSEQDLADLVAFLSKAQARDHEWENILKKFE